VYLVTSVPQTFNLFGCFGAGLVPEKQVFLKRPGIFFKMSCGKLPRIDFTGGTGIRFCDHYRVAIDPDRFSIAIMIAVTVSKPGSGYEMKIADRF